MRFLFVDRIVESSPGQLIRGVKHVTSNDAFLTVDEQGRPCFISSLIGETLGQLAAWNVMELQGFTHRPVAGIVARASMHRRAYVGETLLLESFIERLDDSVMQYRSEAKVGNELVFSIDCALGPLLPMADFIDLDEVKQQFSEINRPGDWSVISKESAPVLNDDLIMGLELPVVPMTFDRIRSSQPGVSLIAEKRISRAAPYFADHFPRKPVLPLTVLLECKLNLAYEFIQRAGYSVHYKMSELRRIKMNEFVYPGDILECFVTVKKQTEDELVLAFRSEVTGKRVCVVDVVLNSQR
ncbi:hydroxymyristoyl-ACP dehydratase [Legionella anisa]|uniref:Hydroxymyristoyl-ACP dehydratase n=1 Tax=Legionella anisa TaxID=28082 RepID=A0AAX0WQ52_9GAMM|nr:hydroxymyristoyl-ACP dehydratase [Legionella anisa]AWN75462.1 hydroxymyristoyl-ACP dehydratase [Legionella anisa]KTC72838.1 3-hydroxymyristoyl-ACP dehydratase [Legionella anisa]MBN5934576.1 hydroxymyristoyl-ACP dehydratase [Legionella anisa]MCW8424350.1 hydroxymyristoyl-ACP dehydratase [Legionella anisa]MCW8446532.1 hydroxymyristoyl-ACP dehydratase [Legionella anisa]